MGWIEMKWGKCSGGFDDRAYDDRVHGRWFLKKYNIFTKTNAQLKYNRQNISTIYSDSLAVICILIQVTVTPVSLPYYVNVGKISEYNYYLGPSFGRP